MNSVVLERLPKSANKSVTLKRRRLYIFPTRQGFLFGLLLLIMLLGSINYNNSMGYILTFLLAGIGHSCILHTYKNLSGLVLTAENAQAVYCGDKAYFIIRIDNSNNNARFSVKLSKLDEGRRFRLSKHADTITDVNASGITHVKLPVMTTERGDLSLGRISISTSYPLGLLMCWSYYDTDVTMLVYPKPMGDSHLPIHQSQQQEQDLGQESGNQDFSGLKPYRPGHSPAHLHWKLYARNEELLLKEFKGGGSQQLTLDWQQLQNLDTERALSQLCLWINIAERDGIAYQLILPSFKSSLNNGEQHQHECLSALARFNA